jgi:hypothetical protein
MKLICGLLATTFAIPLYAINLPTGAGSECPGIINGQAPPRYTTTRIEPRTPPPVVTQQQPKPVPKPAPRPSGRSAK